MRLVKLNEIASSVILELGKINSNEKNKLINLDLIEISDYFDFSDKNIALSSELSNKEIEEFAEHCEKTDRETCLIVFNKNFNSNLFDSVDCKNILLVGLENLESREILFLAENKVRQMNLNSFLTNIEDSTEIIMEFASGKELLLAFDLNILDFDLGGLTSRQAIYILGRMSMMKNLRIALLSGFKEKEKIGARLLAELF